MFLRLPASRRHAVGGDGDALSWCLRQSRNLHATTASILLVRGERQHAGEPRASDSDRRIPAACATSPKVSLAKRSKSLRSQDPTYEAMLASYVGGDASLLRHVGRE